MSALNITYIYIYIFFFNNQLFSLSVIDVLSNESSRTLKLTLLLTYAQVNKTFSNNLINEVNVYIGTATISPIQTMHTR